MRAALEIYRQIKAIHERRGTFTLRQARVLDFGCGWGRITRFFLKDLSPENIYGADVSGVGIDACQRTLPGSFRQISGQPPLEYGQDTFDLIYSWSVFSHLPEDLSTQWLVSFSRLLKPTGLLIVSTLPRSFITQCQKLRELGFLDSAWKKAAAESFENPEVALQSYDRGSFVFSAKHKPEYGMSVIPKAYVLSHWTRFLEFCDFIETPPSIDQWIIVMKKPVY